MSETIKVGKFKGQELDNIVKTKEGRGWLEWIISQPVENNEYTTVNLARNKRWKLKLEATPIQAVVEDAMPTQKAVSSPAKVDENLLTDQVYKENVLFMLESILEQIKLLVKNTANQEVKLDAEGKPIAWDE